MLPLALLALVASAPAEPPGPPWLPELGETFEAYYAGSDDTVRQRCDEWIRTTRRPDLRRQARLLDAFTRLRSPDRDQRSAGRVTLGAITAEQAVWRTEPECRLALARGLLGLAETGAALAEYRAAADAFADRSRTARLLVTLGETAEAWRVHTEWERPTAGLDLPQIVDIERQDEIRFERIAAIRARAAQLPGSGAALQQIDLARAQLLADREQPAEARRLLAEIAGRTPRDANWAAAVLDLARPDPAAHVEVLQHLVEARLGLPSETAARWLDDLHKPVLEIELPATARPDQPLRPTITRRGVSGTSIEVRRIDLPDWLAAQRGRLLTTSLPTAGPLVTQRPVPDGADATWTLSEEAAMRLPRGQYVVVVRGRTADGEALVRPHLLVVSDLDAAVVVGPGAGVLWCSAEDATASFWLHGSFVPKEIAVADGLVRFDLPSGRAVLTDDRWVCLVQAGEDIALCAGRSARPPAAGAEGGIVLTIGPHAPRIGETLTVYGLRVRPATVAGAARPVTIELVDSDGNLHASRTARVEPDGSLLVRFTLEPALAGRTCTLRARVDDTRLPLLYRHPRFTLASPDRGTVRVDFDLPDRLTADAALLKGRVRVSTPGGIPLGGALASVSARAVRLPDASQPYPQPGLTTHERIEKLGEDGGLDFAWPIAAYQLPDGPLALTVKAEVIAWDGRVDGASYALLQAGQPAQVWCEVPAEAVVGRPVPLLVGWGDPRGLAETARPRVTLQGPDGTVTPQLVPTPSGLYGDQWTPRVPGEYVLSAELPLAGHDPVRAAQTFSVVADDAGVGPAPRRLAALWKPGPDGDAVLVRVVPALEEAALLVLDDTDPVAAAVLPPGTTELRLAAPATLSDAARLRVASMSDGRFAWLAAESIRRSADDVTLSATVARAARGPGRSAQVDLKVSGAGVEQALVSARLVSAAEAGTIPWIPAPASPETADASVLDVGTSLAGGVVSEATASLPLSPEVLAAMFEGDAVWLGQEALRDGAGRLRVPLPSEPGRFLLALTLRTFDGRLATASLVLDTTDALALSAELPPDLVIGDRFTSLAEIRNPAASAWEGALLVTPGSGLVLVGAADQNGVLLPVRRDGADQRIALHVPRSGATSVRLVWEAVEPGRGLAKFVLTDGKARLQLGTQRYGVAADEVSHPTGVPLTRRLFTIERPPDAPRDLAQWDAWLNDPEELAQLQRRQLAPDQAVPAGTLVLVQEEWRAEAVCESVRWRQRVPANCLTHNTSQSGLRSIGFRTEQEPRRMTYEIETAGPGLLVHEYVLVATRPGACLLPLPEVSFADGPQRWQAEPVRVVVRDREP